MLVLWSAAASASTPHVSVRDLDPQERPTEEVAFDWKGRLWVDGAIVRGSRGAKLDWLGAVYADENGDPPANLKVDQRHRGLHLEHVACGVSIGVDAALIAGSIVAPPLFLPLSVGVLGVTAVNLGVATHGKRLYDAPDLRDQVLRTRILADLP